MKTTYLDRIKSLLRNQFNVNDYDSLKVGEYLSNAYGSFCLTSKPNLYQPIDSRYWIFEITEDASGEPFVDGPKIIIKSL
jgi:hypothetical protein